MEWTINSGSRLKAWAYDENGSDWSIYFNGYSDITSGPCAGYGVRLVKDCVEIATWALEYNGDEIAAMGYDVEAYIGKYVEEAMGMAESMASGEDEEPAKITNKHGNELDAEKAADFMAQCDQDISDRAWGVAESEDDIQAVFDEFCRIFEEEHGEEFVLATENPQW